MRSDELPDIGRMTDGRLLWIRSKRPTFLVLEGERWVPPVGVTFASAVESKRLKDAEIRDLIASGIVPKDAVTADGKTPSEDAPSDLS